MSPSWAEEDLVQSLAFLSGRARTQQSVGRLQPPRSGWLHGDPSCLRGMDGRSHPRRHRRGSRRTKLGRGKLLADAMSCAHTVKAASTRGNCANTSARTTCISIRGGNGQRSRRPNRLLSVHIGRESYGVDSRGRVNVPQGCGCDWSPGGHASRHRGHASESVSVSQVADDADRPAHFSVLFALVS